MNRTTRQIGALLGLLWVVLVLGAYYIFHKPFQPGEAVGILRTLLDVLGVALLVTVAGGLGRRLLRRALPEGLASLSAPEKLAVDALAGLGLISVAVLALAVIGLISGPLFLGVAVVAAALLARDAAAWWRALLGWLRDGRSALRDGWSVFLVVFLGVMLAMAFVNALAPATKWDALVYHLTGPKLFIEAGRFRGDVDNHFFGFPQLVEMLYLWLMSWRGAAAGAALIHWAFGVLTLMLAGGFAARLTGKARVGLVAAAVLLTAETIWWEFAWPYVDLAAMAYVMAGFVLLDVWREESALPILAVAGLMAGCALGAKYTTVGAVAGLGVLALWSARRNRLRAVLVSGSIFGAVALASFAPWLIKNVILYTNPVYPFFFDAPRWDVYRQAWYTRPGSGLLSTAPLRLLLLPWDATVCSQEGAAGFASPFGDALLLCDPNGKGSLGATIGPLFLVLIPLLAIGWHALSEQERRFVKRAALFLLVPYAVWVYSVATSVLLEQTRLLLQIFPILAVIAALGLESLRQMTVAGVRLGFVIHGAVVFVLAISLLGGVLFTVGLDSVSVIVGARPPNDYLRDQLGWHYAALEEVNRLPDGAGVMFLWEPRSFYCRAGIDCWPDALLDHWYHDMRVSEGDIDAIAARWQAEGITHVLLWDLGMAELTEPGADPFEPGDVEAFAAFADRFLASEWTGENDGERLYTLYRWK